MRRTFGNFEPGSYGLGCADCGLGELLPVIPKSALNTADAAQYDALASGRASGGNFQEFKDGASQGWFTDDAAGYANYLAWNSLGAISPEMKTAPVAYIAWRVAAVFANAVVNKYHVGNNLSPLYDVPTAIKNGQNSINGYASNLGWTSTQRDQAQQDFADNLKRMLAKWGYTAPVSVTVPQLIENPYFKSLGQTVLVDKNTVTFDGPDPDPNIVGGRIFSAGGVTWKWGGKWVVVPPEQYLDIYVDGNNPANPPQYDERGWTMYPTLAWFVLSRGGRDANGQPFPETRTPLTKWTGEYLNYADTGPKGTLLFIDNESPADQAKIRALGGPSTPPSKATWGWGKNTNMPTGTAPEVIPITDPRNPNYKAPGPTVNPWTDVTAPPPPPPSQGSQPVIPPGVPPVETSSGQLVPAATGPGLSPDVAIDHAPVNEMQTAGVDAGSVGKGMGVALLGGLAVLFLLSKPRNRR